MCRNGLFSFVFLFSMSGLCAAANAQDYSAAISVGTGSVAVEGFDDDLSTDSLDAAFDADFGNGFVLGGDISVQNLDVGGFVGEIDTTILAIGGHYRFANGLTVGAYAQRIEIDQPFRAIEVSSRGVTLGYEMERWGIEAFFGRSDFGELDIEAEDYGLIAWALPNDRLTLGASVVHSDIDTTDRDPTLVRLAGVYDLSDSVTVFGGVDALSLNAQDVYTVGLGVGLDLKRLTGVPAILSVEVTHQSIDEMKIDGVELALTIPLGKVSNKAPLGSVAGHVLRPKRSALNGLYDTGVPLF
jgi:Gram-negative porin